MNQIQPQRWSCLSFTVTPWHHGTAMGCFRSFPLFQFLRCFGIPPCLETHQQTSWFIFALPQAASCGTATPSQTGGVGWSMWGSRSTRDNMRIRKNRISSAFSNACKSYALALSLAVWSCPGGWCRFCLPVHTPGRPDSWFLGFGLGALELPCQWMPTNFLTSGLRFIQFFDGFFKLSLSGNWLLRCCGPAWICGRIISVQRRCAKGHRRRRHSFSRRSLMNDTLPRVDDLIWR